MKSVTVVRIYITEQKHLLHPILDYLCNRADVKGATVFRGIIGFGKTGLHKASLVDISTDLPLVIEFFEKKEKVDDIIKELQKMIDPNHILVWPATCY